MVLFDHNQKISQIRMSWDQASLLKQTDVIGSRGKNWPVTDGKDQIRIIVSSKQAAPTPTPMSPTSPRGRDNTENASYARNPSPNKKHIKDPYASLDLFSPKSEEVRESSSTGGVAVRASAKPAPREMSELFAAGHEDLEEKPGSPKKSYNNNLAPKGAGSRKFGAVRVFDDDEPITGPDTSTGYKTNPARYNHFDIGDSDDDDHFQQKGRAKAEPEKAIPMRARTDKHGSQWDFSDFYTPFKVGKETRGQNKVNFEFNDDNQDETPVKGGSQKPRRDAEPHFELQDDGTPVDRHAVPKPRKDADTHFAFQDQPTPAPRRIIARTEAAKGLYQETYNPGDDEEKPPLSNIAANARNNNNARNNTFGSHWDMTDDSPANTKSQNKSKGISDDRKKAVQMMGSQWETHDQSPDTKRPVSKGQPRAMQSHWDIGEEDEPVKHTKPKAGAGGAKSDFWDF